MRQDIRVGDIVSRTAKGATTESKVQRKNGRYLVLSGFEGPSMIYQKEKSVLEDDVILVMK